MSKPTPVFPAYPHEVHPKGTGETGEGVSLHFMPSVTKRTMKAAIVNSLLIFTLILLPEVVNQRVEARVVPDQTISVSGSEKDSSQIGEWLVSLFRDHISAVDGDRCPSYPSCSTYSGQAVKRHGFFVGWVMTVDRLIREGSEETSVSPLVYRDGRQKIFDPVENNDFWWFKGAGSERR